MLGKILKIKVCGLLDKDNLKAVLDLSPDFIGFNFYQDSKRYCKFKSLPDFDYRETKICGVFVNSTSQFIKEQVDRFNLSFVQLHGSETPSYIKALKDSIPDSKIIKVFGIEESNDLNNLKDWEQVADYYLFDKKSVSFGGSGKKFNWDLLRDVSSSKELFLAGGVGPEDTKAIQNLSSVVPKLYAVDINSLFEDSSGLKQVEKIEKFIKELRL